MRVIKKVTILRLIRLLKLSADQMLERLQLFVIMIETISFYGTSNLYNPTESSLSQPQTYKYLAMSL